jgi:drug/metabolite transporter (DMT)-like permease
MLYSAPFFVAMAWWAGRARAPLAGRDIAALVALGCVGYYLASLLDFMGLVHISAALERLVLFLYPTLVLLLSAALHRTRIGPSKVAALALSYCGIVLAFWHDLRIGDDAAAVLLGGSLVFGSAFLYATYLVGSGSVIARLGSMRFTAWAMLASTAFVLGQFALTRPVAALAVPTRIHGLALAMAVFSTVLPTWMIAEAIRRIGADTSSLIGSFGPVFTIGLGALILGESIHPLQLAGAALVLLGVMLVTRGSIARFPAGRND